MKPLDLHDPDGAWVFLEIVPTLLKKFPSEKKTIRELIPIARKTVLDSGEFETGEFDAWAKSESGKKFFLQFNCKWAED